DLAGALISPVLAMAAGTFLCWWTWRMQIRFRWAALILFAISPILVHGTILGRPDHQSLLILLIMVAICADWTVIRSRDRRWSVVSGLAWGLALWVSMYEPLVLLVLSLIGFATMPYFATDTRPENKSSESAGFSITNVGRDLFTAPHRRIGWYVFLAVVGVALLIERRIPSLAIFVNDPLFVNWSRSIGELSPVRLFSGIWLTWLGWLVVVVPFLLGWLIVRKNRAAGFPPPAVILLIALFFLTMWQARWGYFLALIFVLSIPFLLNYIPWRSAAWAVFVLSLWPVLAEWDRKIWPDPATAEQRFEQRHEAVELRALAIELISGDRLPFVAPWWLSPAIAYWSGQPGVAGSSHESLPGIADTARFYLETEANAAGELLQRRGVRRVIAYDAERVEKTSVLILGRAASNQCMAEVLDYRATQAPAFLRLSAQNGTAKIFEVTNKW
ncbi:MAG TPA: hypothetical protein VJ719_16095, partial [Chthoniobacterales bacterium]|nr:hypothetical protein [Chthoniobacterales bacterium]